jgi:hypothetical protein
MLDVIQVTQLPVGRFGEVARIETGLDGIERMKGTLPALVDSLQWSVRLNPDNPPPFSIIEKVNGGVADDTSVILGYLKSFDARNWIFAQDTKKSEAACVKECLVWCNREFLALVPGNVLVLEDKWFEKMQMVYYKDPNCCMVGTEIGLEGNTLAPYRLDQKNHPSGGIVLLRRNTVPMVNWSEIPEDSHLPTELSKQFHAMGGKRWIAPAVRFEELEWQSQEPEKSDTTILFASPSQTTPDSSTVMITGLDGPGDSKESAAK